MDALIIFIIIKINFLLRIDNELWLNNVVNIWHIDNLLYYSFFLASHCKVVLSRFLLYLILIMIWVSKNRGSILWSSMPVFVTQLNTPSILSVWSLRPGDVWHRVGKFYIQILHLSIPIIKLRGLKYVHVIV